MKQYFFAALLLGATLSLQGQNLIPNPSFESYTSPFCGIMSASDFNQTAVNWTVAGGTPDLYFTDGLINSTCYNYQPVNQYPGPIGIKGTETPRTGGVFAAFGAYTISGMNQREYLQTALSTPMTVGKKYIVEFYVSLADNIESYTDKIGAHLSTTAIIASGSNVLNDAPQVEASGFISNYSGWTKVSDTITASQPYSYITIGNFYNDNNTTVVSNPNASNGIGSYGAYYYIDDVRIEEVSIGLAVSNLKENSILVYPNPVEDLLMVEITQDYIEGQLSVYNVQGQLLQSQTITKNKMQLDWSNLPQGIYVVQLKNNQEVLTKQVVKR